MSSGSPFSSHSRPQYGGFSTASPAASRSQWWSNDSAGAGGASHSALDDRMDEPEQAPNHLPGFLTASGRGGRSPATTDANSGSNSQQQWMSSSGSRAMPSPPSTRFGAGGLFDRTNTSPYNSPQAPHTLPLSISHEDAPPIASLEDGDMYDGDMQQDFSPPTSRIEPPPPSSSSNPLAATIIVFGPPMSMLQPLLQHFNQFGEIITATPDQSGGNWVTITYRSEQEASRAIRKNGDVLGGTYMIGVKWADPTHPASLDSPYALRPSPSHSPKPTQVARLSPATPLGQGGRSIQLAPSSSAFRRLDQQAGTPVKAAPLQSAAPAQKQGGGEGKQGVLGKLGEYVFGF